MFGDLLLRDFKPRTALVTKDHTPEGARFPVIDVHNHLESAASELIALMDELNVHCVVNLDGGWGEQLAQHLARYKRPYPDRFCVFAWIDWRHLDEPDFGEKQAQRLADAVAAGARGLKVFKELGLVHRDRWGKLIRPDDSRLDPIWAMAGELYIPVLIHTADPVAFFWPLDEYNERWEELYEHPDWHFYGDDYPSHIELIESQLRIVERHPGTTFISAHVLSYAENLRYVAQALDRYPNLYVDIGERIGELGRQPYTSRWFLTQYADRVLFGTDIPPNKETYRTYFRCLETADEYFDHGRNQGRYRIYGLDLPDEALRKIYYENACQLIPGLIGPEGGLNRPIAVDERMKPVESPLLHTLRQTAALRHKWEQGAEPSFLGWITMLDPAVAEMEVEWGYDGLVIDTEHSTYDVTALRATLMAFRGTDCVPLVRVGANDIYLIKTALDLGAGGVLIPLIQDADDARAAVEACRYPPQGIRGVSPRRASNYFRDVEVYLAEANRSILVMIQIESETAYQNLDAILEVDGIDCFLVGMVDLSASMNHMWDVEHPEVIETVEDIIRRCRRAGRSVAVASAANARQIKRWLDVGANVMSFGGDMGFMRAGFDAFKASMEQAGLPFAQRS